MRFLTLAKTRRRQENREGLNCGHDAAGCGDTTATTKTTTTTTTGPRAGRHLEDFRRIRDIEWDMVIGSDLIYNDMGVECLPRVGRRE